MNLNVQPVAVVRNRERSKRPEHMIAVQHLTDLLAGADAGLALFDEDLKLVFANDRYLTLCGYSRQEAAMVALNCLC